MSNTQTGGKEFYSALEAKATKAVASIFKSPIVPIEYPAQGDFLWNYQNTNGVFNSGTYDYINANVSPGTIPGTAKLSSAGGFANAYVAILNNMEFSLSTANAQKLSAAQSNANIDMGTMVTNYEASFGQITPAQLTEAGVTQKSDYIIQYVIGSKWSGATPPLSYTTLTNARNMKALLPNLPMSGNQTIADVTQYLNKMAPVNALQDALANGAWTLKCLKNNTMTPSASNGGMQTVDPTTGALNSKYNDKFIVSKSASIAAINSDLQNTQRTIDIGMSSSSASGSSLTVSVDAQAGFSVGSLISFGVDTKNHYDMTKIQGTSQDCTVEISYKGYSMVPVTANAWQQATNEGWFFADPIKQAYANQGKDVDGYKFVSPPTYNMDKFCNGGDFGLLNNVLIANYPDVTITYSHADFNSFKQNWSSVTTANLTLFGFIKLGSVSTGVYGSSYKQGADNSTFSVTFSASPAVTATPQLQKTAYVIGGAVNNPAV